MRILACIGIILLGRLVALAQAQQEASLVQPSGKFCTTTRATAGDGDWTQCILVLTTAEKSGAQVSRGLLWVEGECTRCKGKAAAPYVSRGPAPLTAIAGGLSMDVPGLPPLFPEKSAFVFQKQPEGVALAGPDLYGEASVYQREKSFGDFQPSFDCSRAHLPRERAVCSSPQLSFLDQQLSLTYRAATYCAENAHNGSLARLTASQNAWWAGKLAACHSGDCVDPLYRERMAELARTCPQK